MASIEEIQRHGRNLNVVSSAIILFVIGGAHFSKEGTLLFGSVVFENIPVLEFAAVLALLYYYFRYYLSNRENWPKIKQSVLINRLLGDTRFRRYADKKAQEYIDKLIEQGKQIGNVDWQDKPPNVHPMAELFKEHHTPIEVQKFQPKVHIRAKRNGGGKLEDFLIDIDRNKFCRYYLKTWYRYIRYNEEFLDKVLPYLIAYLAAGCIIWEFITRLIGRFPNISTPIHF